MQRCSQCNKLIILKSANADLCRKCYRINAERKAQEEQARKEAKIAAVKRVFSAIEVDYNSIKEMRFNDSLDQVRRNLALCNEFEFKFKKCVSMPYITEAISLSKNPYSPGMLQVGNLDLLPYELIDNNTIKINFDPVIERTHSAASKCRLFIEQTEQFVKDLEALPKVEFAIQDDPGELPRTSPISVSMSNITVKTSRARVSTFIAVDVETTGLSPIYNEIIELAAVKFVDFTPKEAFHTYLKPRHGLNPSAQSVNHITEAMVDDAPYFEQILPAFNDYISGVRAIVGHNLLFDYNFLSAKRGILFHINPHKFYDTLDIGKKEFRYHNLPNNKLSTYCEHILNIARDDAHSALSDALATGLIFRYLCQLRIG